MITEDLGRFRPMVCSSCESVGTIVEMGLCCEIHRLSALGGLWDIPDWRKAKRPNCKRPGRRRG
jgi:hypothetical protein